MIFRIRLDQPRGSFNRVYRGPTRAQYFHGSANTDRSVRARYDDHMPSAVVHRPIASRDCSMAIEGVVADRAPRVAASTVSPKPGRHRRAMVLKTPRMKTPWLLI